MHAFVFILLAPALALATGPAAEKNELPEGPAMLRHRLADIVQRRDRQALDRLWDRLVEEGQIPFVRGDSVLFLYRGPAESVAFPDGTPTARSADNTTSP